MVEWEKKLKNGKEEKGKDRKGRKDVMGQEDKEWKGRKRKERTGGME